MWEDVDISTRQRSSPHVQKDKKLVHCEKDPIIKMASPEPRYEFDRVPMGLNRKKNKFTKCVANISNPTKSHAKRGVGTNLSERIGRIDQLNAKKVGRIEKGQWGTNKILKIYITRIKIEFLLHDRYS